MNNKKPSEQISTSIEGGWRVDDFFKKAKSFFYSSYFIGIVSSSLVFSCLMILKNYEHKAQISDITSQMESALAYQQNEFIKTHSDFREEFLKTKKELYQKEQESQLKEEIIIKLSSRLEQYQEAIRRYNEIIRLLLEQSNNNKNKSEA